MIGMLGRKRVLNTASPPLVLSYQLIWWVVSRKWGESPGGHCWGYNPGTLSFSQVIFATHLKIKGMKSTGAQWVAEWPWLKVINKLQWTKLKIGHQDSSSSNDHQGDMPYYKEQVKAHYAYSQAFLWATNSHSGGCGKHCTKCVIKTSNDQQLLWLQLTHCGLVIKYQWLCTGL